MLSMASAGVPRIIDNEQLSGLIDDPLHRFAKAVGAADDVPCRLVAPEAVVHQCLEDVITQARNGGV